MIVEEILAVKGNSVVTVRPDAEISRAVKLLTERGIGAVLVSRDDVKALGILSERDIVQALDEKGAALLRSKVSDIMTRTIVTCRPDSSLDEVMELMTKSRFRHLPVIANGEIKGIVSIGDIVKYRTALVAANS